MGGREERGCELIERVSESVLHTSVKTPTGLGLDSAFSLPPGLSLFTRDRGGEGKKSATRPQTAHPAPPAGNSSSSSCSCRVWPPCASPLPSDCCRGPADNSRGSPLSPVLAISDAQYSARPNISSYGYRNVKIEQSGSDLQQKKCGRDLLRGAPYVVTPQDPAHAQSTGE